MVVWLANVLVVLLGYVSKVLDFGLERLSLKKVACFSKIHFPPFATIAVI